MPAESSIVRVQCPKSSSCLFYWIAFLLFCKQNFRPYRVGFSDRFHLGRLRDHLRSQHVGRVTMVKRGSLLDSDDVTKKLKLNGPEHRMVILTRVNGDQTAIVGNRV